MFIASWLRAYSIHLPIKSASRITDYSGDLETNKSIRHTRSMPELRIERTPRAQIIGCQLYIIAFIRRYLRTKMCMYITDINLGDVYLDFFKSLYVPFILRQMWECVTHVTQWNILTTHFTAIHTVIHACYVSEQKCIRAYWLHKSRSSDITACIYIRYVLYTITKLLTIQRTGPFLPLYVRTPSPRATRWLLKWHAFRKASFISFYHLPVQKEIEILS